ncbi:General secretion pathway protein A [hydrothermal vent metagenome]|uniref:General secretion pathway protein A n=1 Tax=hydrothermal vent metagenome TaxID=652676 RepID=A0A3B0XNB0_9ZZZZ
MPSLTKNLNIRYSCIVESVYNSGMYLDYFGLLEPPFSIAPDPRYLYMSERHREALAHLLYGMESDGAFILLTGDVGTGKTTVSRCLLEQVPEDTNLALVLNPKLTSLELLQVICDELRIAYNKKKITSKILVDYINRYLLGAHAQGKKTVVLIEEAQNLDLDVLEQLRLLTNLETNQRKLLQVILLGQPEFLDVLDRPELSQLAQRITARFHLTPLKLSEVEEYVAHRLAIAGCRRPIFIHGVIKGLYKYSGGVPRLINVICDRALLGCYVQNKHHIDKPTLVGAAREVLGENKAAAIKTKITPRQIKLFAIAAALLMSVALVLYFFDFKLKSSVEKNNEIETAVPQKIAETETIKKNTDNIKNIEKKTAIENIELNDAVAENFAPVTLNKDQSDAMKEEQDIADDERKENKGKIQRFIIWPDSSQRLRSNFQSYQALFERWQFKYNILTNGTPCFFAKTKGLSCMHEESDMQSLREFNRPAVLTLYDDLNQRQYVTLIELGETMAKIVVAGKIQNVPIEQLLFYWKGEFSFLWRKPPGYVDLIRPGNSGDAVLWLSKAMSEINKQPTNNVQSYYDKELVNQVKSFQSREGLTSDGVVGVKTLMRINQSTQTPAPKLETS